jgi:hypothetical protein
VTGVVDWRGYAHDSAIMLERSIKLATNAYVFEQNVSTTWLTIKSMILNFLTNIWKQGGLMGAVPQDAFTVYCGLGETMTPEDVLGGILRVTVLVAVMHPAEFIEITFSATDAEIVAIFRKEGAACAAPLFIWSARTSPRPLQISLHKGSPTAATNDPTMIRVQLTSSSQHSPLPLPNLNRQPKLGSICSLLFICLKLVAQPNSSLYMLYPTSVPGGCPDRAAARPSRSKGSARG